MEILTTREAAERIGVTVKRFHFLTAKHSIDPAVQGSGKRGEKFWRPRDVERLLAEHRKHIHAEIEALKAELGETA